ncbi:MAG: FAD/NAD(P)-binding oxidoreductase [Bacteroidales bacterium]|nr:FAD/NAD(P)-binding oxidoreductase [Bacteroidales bacterium]MDT8373617.1 FAD/NAD(P)-binding oxidoreductase [Bacteroidales bacterium]
MKRIVILGAGTAGIMMSNKLHKHLAGSEFELSVIEKEDTHYYQPGFLFLPFGHYKKKDIAKPVNELISKGAELIKKEADRIDAEGNEVLFKDGSSISYDILIIATGARIVPEDTPGLKGELWQKKIFDFYTIEGASALAEFFETWEGGRLVVNVADNPIKCPVAPIEFCFYALDCFRKRGIGNKMKITYVTPLSGAFTKPKASKMLGSLLEDNGIELVTDFFLGEVDNENMKIRDFGGREVEFDCLVTIPLHSGDPVISKSGLGDEFGFVKADKNTLQSVLFKNIFVIGDAGNYPVSKAGSVAHFQAEVLEKNIMSFIKNEPLKESFDGHSNCFIETGRGKGILIDFNYDTEPLPGTFPVPVLGPMKLLKESRINHWGKLAFKWIYWKILLPGRKMPISAHMSMAGKKTD